MESAGDSRVRDKLFLQSEVKNEIVGVFVGLMNLKNIFYEIREVFRVYGRNLELSRTLKNTTVREKWR